MAFVVCVGFARLKLLTIAEALANNICFRHSLGCSNTLHTDRLISSAAPVGVIHPLEPLLAIRVSLGLLGGTNWQAAKMFLLRPFARFARDPNQIKSN